MENAYVVHQIDGELSMFDVRDFLYITFFQFIVALNMQLGYEIMKICPKSGILIPKGL